MNRSLFVIAFLASGFCFFGCQSSAFVAVTEADRTISYDFDYSVSDEQAFRLSKLWIAENFNSARDVISFEDAEMGIIMGKFSVELYFAIRPVTSWMNFKLIVKNGKAALEFSNITIGGNRIMYMNQKEAVMEKTDALYNALKIKI